MKNIIFFFAFLSGFQAISQDHKRVQVNGKIIVESSDISGITIFNKSTQAVTVTDENGEFILLVGLNDFIEVSALQFQNINFQVNEDIILSKSMKVFLIEEINKLEEVIILSNRLSGDLRKDIKSTKTFNPKLDALYFSISRSEDFEFTEDNKSAVTNITMNSQRQSMINGLNIVNVVDQILLPLFRSEAKSKKDSGVSEVPVEAIKYYFGSEFLSDNFKIPKHRVAEFIRFVESENFDFSLLNYGREMEFLQLLHDKSLEFLDKNKSN